MGIKRIIKSNKWVWKTLCWFSWLGSGRGIVQKKHCEINRSSSLSIKSKIKVNGIFNKIIIEPYCVLRNCTININGNGNTLIVRDHTTIIDGVIYLTENDNSIEIGANTTIAGSTDLVAGEGHKITIGEKCLFSKGITVRTGDAHSITDNRGIRINESSDVTIGNHVWLTQDVKVLKGAKIGDDCVVATGAIVTKNFSDTTHSIIGGIPANLLKTGISWLNERI